MLHSLARAPAENQRRDSGATYRPDIDGLRAIAVLAVIVNHFDRGLLPNGQLGVDIFFVISGFVITGSLAGHSEHRFWTLISSFYARRMKRLLPALCVCVLVSSVLACLFINPQSAEFRSSLRTGMDSLFGASNILLYVSAIDYFGVSAELNVFTHTWSLGVEEQFYLLMPVIFWLSGYGRGHDRGALRFAVVLGVMSAASLVLFLVLVPRNAMAAYFLMPPRFWELGAGCLCYAASAHGLVPRKAASTLAAAALPAMAVALFGAPESGASFTLLAVMATAALLFYGSPGSVAYRLLSHRHLVLIGLISYSLYLWHWPILVLSRWTVGVQPWTVPFVIGLIAVASVLSFRFVERPARKAAWSYSRVRTILYASLAAALSLGVVFTLLIPLRGALYTGDAAVLTKKGANSLLDEKYVDGRLIWKPTDCVLAANTDVGKSIRADACSIGNLSAARRRFLVVGNSFSAAEFEMVSVLAEKGLGAVILTSSWGAPAVPGADFPTNPWAPANNYYWSTTVPTLINELRPGDSLVMINDMAPYSPAAPSDQDEMTLNRFQKGITQFAEDLERKGIEIIFQAGNPFMRDAHCSPDLAQPQWFNRSGSVGCIYFTREETLRRRSRLHEVLLRVAREHANFHVLDLMDVFCPGAVCRMTNPEGVFLYRDSFSHPSVEANLLARSTFLGVAQSAMR